jgi:hypothetical protein
VMEGYRLKASDSIPGRCRDLIPRHYVETDYGSHSEGTGSIADRPWN